MVKAAIFVLFMLGVSMCAGCVENDPIEGSESDETISIVQTANATRADYHQEYTGSVAVYDPELDMGLAEYTFPVEEGVKKIILAYDQTNVIPPVAATGAALFLEDPEGNENGPIYSGQSVEFREKDSKPLGDWQARVVLQIDSVSCEYSLTIDVIYS